MIYSPQKRAALTRSRLSREAAERQAEFYRCQRHPDRANLGQCEDCIREGFELRITHVGRHSFVHIPTDLDRAMSQEAEALSNA